MRRLTLREWAELNEMDYQAAYKRYIRGTLGLKVDKDHKGNLFIDEDEQDMLERLAETPDSKKALMAFLNDPSKKKHWIELKCMSLLADKIGSPAVKSTAIKAIMALWGRPLGNNDESDDRLPLDIESLLKGNVIDDSIKEEPKKDDE